MFAHVSKVIIHSFLTLQLRDKSNQVNTAHGSYARPLGTPKQRGLQHKLLSAGAQGEMKPASCRSSWMPLQCRKHEIHSHLKDTHTKYVLISQPGLSSWR